MSLQRVFAGIHPDWYHQSGGDGRDTDFIDDALLRRAQDSALGRRMLARWLMREIGGELLAPRPDGAIAAPVVRWPRARLAGLLRDLGVLALAPAIRAEVRREPVRQLRRALGNSYLLALDKQVWDGKVEAPVASRLRAGLGAALADSHDDAPLHALFDRQGRGELHAWAAQGDPALAEWMRLQFPRETPEPAHLPPKQVQFLHDHHLARTGGD
ncbi:MAG TPA: hypothetical protein VFF71_02690 [Luteimonas sp.]|nr:hypothetical protein [Luteimonas sp.]